MVFSTFRQWWRRLWQKWPWRRRGVPTWGEHSPTVLGVCRECGAVVLEGWHREVEGGFLCRRCAHRSARR